MVDTAKKVDPEDEQKLVEFIQSELLRNVDPKSVRTKLVQAGWLETDVLRLIELATTKPDFRDAKPVKPVDLEHVLVFQKDGNLKLQQELINAQIRKKREEDQVEVLKAKPVMVEERKLTLEQKVLMVRKVVQTAFVLLLIYHAWLLQQFLG